MSIKTVTQSQKTSKNNRIFVYKIIHDLRHPTQALADGLNNLIEEF